MLGAGAICVKIFKQKYLIAACYDGNIYIFDINSNDDGAVVNITGPSNMLLAMDVWEGKVNIVILKNLYVFYYFSSLLDHCLH